MKRIRILIGMLVMVVLLGIYSPTEMQAADSYTDPKTFFETTEDKKSHAEFTDQYIYFCTKGKTAASTSQMRFYTLGFQITATGNGASMSIDVKRGGNYLKQVDEKAYDDGFTYTLYRIKYDDICTVMGNKNSTTWNNINKATWVTFQMDAIMTYKPSGSDIPACTITAESTTGKITPSTSKLWYTNNSEDLSELEDMFSVGRFEHYKGIQQPLRNNTLTVNFYAKYTDVTSASGYKINPTTSQITLSNGTAFQRTGNRFGTVVLPNPASTTEFGLKRTGYKIVSGKEWTNNAGTSFLASNTSGTATTSISSSIATATQGLTVNLYANWTPITYIVKYMPNEKGTGNSTPQSFKYDTSYTAAQNMFYSDTHDFVGWNTKADGSGDWYYVGDTIKNLSSTDGQTVFLYAQWKPKIFEISVDLNGATGGTDKFYEVYDTRFTLKEDSTTGVTKITPPTGDELPRGYHYIGAYASKYNENQQIIDVNGNIMVANDHYIGNKTIYSKYEPLKAFLLAKQSLTLQEKLKKLK